VQLGGAKLCVGYMSLKGVPHDDDESQNNGQFASPGKCVCTQYTNRDEIQCFISN